MPMRAHAFVGLRLFFLQLLRRHLRALDWIFHKALPPIQIFAVEKRCESSRWRIVRPFAFAQILDAKIFELDVFIVAEETDVTGIAEHARMLLDRLRIGDAI